MKTLNFNEGNILGCGELIEYNQQLRDEFKALINEMGNRTRGIFLNRNPNSLEVILGNNVGGYNTISLSDDGFYVASPLTETPYADPILTGVTLNGITDMSRDIVDDLFVVHQKKVLNFQIPNISTTNLGDIKYIVSIPRLTVFEEGTCNISTSGQVVFTDSNIVKKLRTQQTNSPSKLTFFTDDSTKYRSGEIFEVLSIINDTTITITGDFTIAGSNLYCAIVGSYDLQPNINLVDKYQYAYYVGELRVMDGLDDLNGGVALAKLTFNIDHSFVIEDLRASYRYLLESRPEWVNIEPSLSTTPNYATYIDILANNAVWVRENLDGTIDVKGKLTTTGTTFPVHPINTNQLRLTTLNATEPIVARVKCRNNWNVIDQGTTFSDNEPSPAHYIIQPDYVNAANYLNQSFSDGNSFVLRLNSAGQVNGSPITLLFSFKMYNYDNVL